MTTATISKKLHDYINVADDKKVETMYTIMQEGLTWNEVKHLSKSKKADLMKQASNDLLFLADLKGISDDFRALDNETL